MIIKRNNKQIKYLIQKREEVIEIDKRQFDSRNGIEDVIRIHEKDYPFIPTDTPHYAHFNLQISNHKVGKIYALPKIIVPGHFSKNGEEVHPILSFEECYIGECIYVKQEVLYEDLTSQDLICSLTNIKTIDNLKREVLFRYSISMPDLTEEEIITLGIAITNIKIRSKLSLN